MNERERLTSKEEEMYEDRTSSKGVKYEKYEERKKILRYVEGRKDRERKGEIGILRERERE